MVLDEDVVQGVDGAVACNGTEGTDMVEVTVTGLYSTIVYVKGTVLVL